MFPTKTVDSIIKSFTRTIAQLEARSKECFRRVVEESQSIDEARHRRDAAHDEGVRAATIAGRIRAIVETPTEPESGNAD